MFWIGFLVGLVAGVTFGLFWGVALVRGGGGDD